MPRQCKVCSLPPELKGVVDKQLLDGVLNRQVALYLTNRGIEITAPSIDRHKKNCLGIEPAPNKNTRNENIESEEQTPLDVKTVIMDAIGRVNHNNMFQTTATDVCVSSILLSDILRNQLALLKIAQEKYIAGTGHYPKDQFRDLQVIRTLSEDVYLNYKKRYEPLLKSRDGKIDND